MQVEYCDVCGLVIKNKSRVIPVDVKAMKPADFQKHMVNSLKNMFDNEIEVKEIEKFKYNADMCEDCKESFRKACAFWETQRKKETEGLRWNG